MVFFGSYNRIIPELAKLKYISHNTKENTRVLAGRSFYEFKLAQSFYLTEKSGNGLKLTEVCGRSI